ncbi:unnamed protein product [Nippostrongylus brasiliensis]|uniref:Secreted protein n=1 Tax=Nippostrongylus brasiliensis TaxID=27835 RepID=A0A0N4YWZ4_NIPBR|nr:unnamed protein product [Nippostrongylus brasiliensis]
MGRSAYLPAAGGSGGGGDSDGGGVGDGGGGERVRGSNLATSVSRVSCLTTTPNVKEINTVACVSLSSVSSGEEGN